MIPIDSRWLFTLLVAAVMAARLFELRRAARNTRAALAAGGVEAGGEHYPWMVALHTAFLASCLLEVWLLRPPLIPRLALAMLGLLLAAGALRLWVIRTLGERWTTRVIVLPDRPLVTGGPYRFLRHPNYLAVMVEIAALPLTHTAWITALVFTLANACLLAVRIRVEERALGVR